MDNAIGLGIILSLQDRASAGLKAIRNKLTALRDVSDSMIKRFDEGAKQMMAGFGSMVAGAKVLGIMNNTFGVSVNTAADFEQAMARVGAVSGAVGKDFEALTKQARDLGRDTQYSATQVANSQELLARAGFQTNEIISAMPGLLNMTAAEGMDLVTGADIAASALRGFGMSVTEMNRVADVLAKTSSASNTSISLLGESLKYVAKYAASFGFTIEQTNAMLGAMANSGIKGSQAGTALRAAFQRLSREPKAVAEALDKLGVSSRDAHGNLRALPDLMVDLSKKLAGMGTGDKMKYLANIFGAEASTGMLAIMEAVADKSLPELERALYGCSGAAKQMADRMNATAQGAMKRLESASEGMRIAIGNHLLSVYTKAINLMAQFKSWLTQLIEEHPIISTAVIGFTVALLGLSGTALILVGALASVGGMIKMWPLLRKMAVYALTSIKAQARMALTSLSGLSVPVIGMIALAGALYYTWRKNLWGIRDMVMAVTEGFRMAWSASTDGIAEIDDALAKKLKAAGILDYAIIVGQVFFRIRKFISGFIEGLKDTYNFVVGIFDWLKGIFSPVIESGQELLKFLGILKPVAKTQTDTWRSWGQLLGRFAPAVIGVVAAFKGMRIIKGIFWDLGKAILGMFSLITAHPIIALITIIAGLAVYAYNHWDEITEYVSEKWQKITGLCAKAADWVKRKWQALKNWWNSWTLKDIFAPLIDLAVRAWNFVKRKWNDFRKWWDSWTLKDLFAPVLNFASAIKDKVLKKWEEFKSWWDSWSLPDIFAGVKDSALGAIDYVKGLWDSFSLKDILPEGFSFSWEGLTAGFEEAKGAITSGIAEISKVFTLENIGNFGATLVSNFKGNIERLKNIALSAFENVRGVISSVDFSGIWGSLASGFATVCDSIKGAWEGVTGFIKKTWDTVSDSVSGAWNWTLGLFGYDTDSEDLQKQVQDITALNKMSEGFAQRVAEMTQAWQPFKLSLGEGFTQIYMTMQGVADRIRGTVIPAVNELASALSRVASEISAVAQAGNLNVSMKALNPGTVSNVPMQYQQTIGGVRKRAEGGIITRPEFAFIGEAGREAVIPLENRARGFSLWLEAGRELGMLPVNTITNQREISDSLIHNSAERSITRSMAENSVLRENSRREIDLFSDRRTSSNIINVISPESLDSIMMSNTLLKYFAETSSIKPEIMNLLNVKPLISGITPHADGGIFSQPHLGLVAEAGREAIIPLEKQSRGAVLWMQAGRELGLLSTGAERLTSHNSITVNSQHNSQAYDVIQGIINPLKLQPNVSNTLSIYSMLKPNSFMSESNKAHVYMGGNLEKRISLSTYNTWTNRSSSESISNTAAMNTQNISQAYSVKSPFNFAGMNVPVIPHAAGGIFSQPHVGLVAEAGREAIIPLERQSQGTQLWFQAGRELGLLPDRKTSSSVNTFTSAMMNVINPESFNSTSNNARSYSSIMNILKYPAEAISMKPEITYHLNINPLINSITPHTDSEIISQSKILQAYDVIPRIVNALRFQPNVLNTASTYNRVQNTSKSYADNMNILNPLLDMMLVNRFSPEHKEAQFYSIMPEIINSIKLQPNLEGVSENRKLYQDMNTVMNRISPESVSNVATMNTQRISQVYNSITRIVNAMNLQSKNISINHNIEGISRTQKHNIFQYYSIQNAAPLLQAREITNNFAGMNTPIIPHAMGGIFLSPHIGLIAEAGREAVIPLDDRSRGIPLLMAAANEIGGADFIINQPYSMPMLIQQTQNQTAFQTAERQPDTRGNIAVNVDVKPADVYIDGERIGRISFRWSERQTIRNGIDS